MSLSHPSLNAFPAVVSLADMRKLKENSLREPSMGINLINPKWVPEHLVYGTREREEYDEALIEKRIQRQKLEAQQVLYQQLITQSRLRLEIREALTASGFSVVPKTMYQFFMIVLLELDAQHKPEYLLLYPYFCKAFKNSTGEYFWGFPVFDKHFVDTLKTLDRYTKPAHNAWRAGYEMIASNIQKHLVKYKSDPICKGLALDEEVLCEMLNKYSFALPLLTIFLYQMIRMLRSRLNLEPVVALIQLLEFAHAEKEKLRYLKQPKDKGG